MDTEGAGAGVGDGNTMRSRPRVRGARSKEREEGLAWMGVRMAIRSRDAVAKIREDRTANRCMPNPIAARARSVVTASYTYTPPNIPRIGTNTTWSGPLGVDTYAAREQPKRFGLLGYRIQRQCPPLPIRRPLVKSATGSARASAASARRATEEWRAVEDGDGSAGFGARAATWTNTVFFKVDVDATAALPFFSLALNFPTRRSTRAQSARTRGELAHGADGGDERKESRASCCCLKIQPGNKAAWRGDAERKEEEFGDAQGGGGARGFQGGCCVDEGIGAREARARGMVEGPGDCVRACKGMRSSDNTRKREMKRGGPKKDTTRREEKRREKGREDERRKLSPFPSGEASVSRLGVAGRLDFCGRMFPTAQLRKSRVECGNMASLDLRLNNNNNNHNIEPNTIRWVADAGHPLRVSFAVMGLNAMWQNRAELNPNSAEILGALNCQHKNIVNGAQHDLCPSRTGVICVTGLVVTD
ncbi:hypothetical protein C8R45DRAFT_1081847 [Mycena sanguinolenta]|nr:hypothetical protein C8R45DRAFT_1081847 [Mycena sanguinolenta]